MATDRQGKGKTSEPPRGANDRVVGWVTLFAGAAISAFLYWRNHDERLPMGFDEYNLLNTAMILFVPLVLILLVLRREPQEFGFEVGDLGKGLWYVLIAFMLFVPVIAIVARQPDSQAYYIGWMSESRAFVGILGMMPGIGRGMVNGNRLAYHELVMGFYMFGWEFFFRGFLLNGLRRWAPLWAAILIQAAFFTALHVSKPWPEVISSFPGAIIMALLAIRTRSFVPCFLLHFLISVGFDVAVLYYHFH